MKYHYFISYLSNNSHGNCKISLDKPIDNIELIREIEKNLNKANNARCCVINYLLLSTD